MINPRLTLIQESKGRDEALVFFQGYLSASVTDGAANQRWWDGIRQAGWRGAIYHFWWDASSMAELVREVRTALLLPGVGRLMLRPRLGQAAGTVFLNWQRVKRRARVIGLTFAPGLLRREVKERRISLMGFSTGARVLYFLLKSDLAHDLRFQDAVLCGGALSRGLARNWDQVADRLDGTLLNVYNSNDLLLRYLYRAGQVWPKRPCGLREIVCDHPKIRNIDVTKRVRLSWDNHWDYPLVLPEAAGELLWRSSEETQRLPGLSGPSRPKGGGQPE